MFILGHSSPSTGAYTNQICNIDPHYGNALVHLETITSNMNISLPETDTWYNNATMTNGSSCVVDGAKRDRQVWPGDMFVALPSIFVSTNDLVPVKNSLDSLLALQNVSTGMMPYAGYPFSDLGIVSFTYHLYSLIGISYRSRNPTHNIPIYFLFRIRSSLPLLLPHISSTTHPQTMGLHVQRSPHDKFNIHRRLLRRRKSALRSIHQ